MKAQRIRSQQIIRMMILVMFIAALSGCSETGGAPVSSVLTHNLSAPLNGATSAIVDIYSGIGNLIIDPLAIDAPVLASGTLQYFESQGAPDRSINTIDGRTTLKLKSGPGRLPLFRLPWSTNVTATEWQIHLNSSIPSDVTARSGGGNIRINLAGMSITRLSADTGGGNMDVVLPNHAANLGVAARTGSGNVSVDIGSDITGTNMIEATSGAGNLVVRMPGTLAARIHATTGLGKMLVDSRFVRLDKETYQSPDYESATSKVDIALHSGAGNVSVNIK